MVYSCYFINILKHLRMWLAAIIEQLRGMIGTMESGLPRTLSVAVESLQTDCSLWMPSLKLLIAIEENYRDRVCSCSVYSDEI